MALFAPLLGKIYLGINSVCLILLFFLHVCLRLHKPHMMQYTQYGIFYVGSRIENYKVNSNI